jgi:uncharacterized protein YbbK (DUF523 family)
MDGYKLNKGLLLSKEELVIVCPEQEIGTT